MDNNREDNASTNKSISNYAERSSVLAHSLLVKFDQTFQSKINSEESVSLASDLAHIWASCKTLGKQIETFCPVSGDVDQSNAIEMLTNLEHMYSHASTSITVLSKIMSVNNILVEEEF